MSNNVLVNDTVRIKVKFIDYNSSTGEQEEVSPNSVNVLIKNSENLTIVSTSATSLSSSEYYYDFTPTLADQYSVKFTGLMGDGSQIIVTQNLYVSEAGNEYKPTITLRDTETITFAADVEPLYLNPEELLAFFPEASLIEIGELVHFYSIEVKQLYSFNDDVTGSDVSFNVLDYIKASVACELSRTYSYGGDDEVGVTLGDLSITSRTLPRSQINRGNATTWCQIASALRKEMLAGKVGPKGFQPKGLPGLRDNRNIDPQTGKTIYLSDRDLYGPGDRTQIQDDPMPKRGLRSYD